MLYDSPVLTNNDHNLKGQTMKKLTTIFFTCFIAVLWTQNVNAQGFGITAGAGYGSEIESIGIQAGVLYSFTDDIRSAVDFVYFLPKEIGGADFTWMEVNANAHYFLVNDVSMKLYGLAGVNLAFLTVEMNFMGTTIKGNDTETGANLGAGFEYMLGTSASIYAEAKYVLGNADQFGGFGGVRFYF